MTEQRNSVPRGGLRAAFFAIGFCDIVPDVKELAKIFRLNFLVEHLLPSFVGRYESELRPHLYYVVTGRYQDNIGMHLFRRGMILSMFWSCPHL